MIFSLTILNAEKKGNPFFENHKSTTNNNSQIKQSREIGQQINIHCTTPCLEENPTVIREFRKNYLYRIKNYETKWVEMKYCLP
jgi:hypothetical protein